VPDDVLSRGEAVRPARRPASPQEPPARRVLGGPRGTCASDPGRGTVHNQTFQEIAQARTGWPVSRSREENLGPPPDGPGNGARTRSAPSAGRTARPRRPGAIANLVARKAPASPDDTVRSALRDAGPAPVPLGDLRKEFSTRHPWPWTSTSTSWTLWRPARSARGPTTTPSESSPTAASWYNEASGFVHRPGGQGVDGRGACRLRGGPRHPGRRPGGRAAGTRGRPGRPRPPHPDRPGRRRRGLPSPPPPGRHRGRLPVRPGPREGRAGHRHHHRQEGQGRGGPERPGRRPRATPRRHPEHPRRRGHPPRGRPRRRGQPHRGRVGPAPVGRGPVPGRHPPDQRRVGPAGPPDHRTRGQPHPGRPRRPARSRTGPPRGIPVGGRERPRPEPGRVGPAGRGGAGGPPGPAQSPAGRQLRAAAPGRGEPVLPQQPGRRGGRLPTRPRGRPHRPLRDVRRPARRGRRAGLRAGPGGRATEPARAGPDRGGPLFPPPPRRRRLPPGGGVGKPLRPGRPPVPGPRRRHGPAGAGQERVRPAPRPRGGQEGPAGGRPVGPGPGGPGRPGGQRAGVRRRPGRPARRPGARPPRAGRSALANGRPARADRGDCRQRLRPVGDGHRRGGRGHGRVRLGHQGVRAGNPPGQNRQRPDDPGDRIRDIAAGRADFTGRPPPRGWRPSGRPAGASSRRPGPTPPPSAGSTPDGVRRPVQDRLPQTTSGPNLGTTTPPSTGSPRTWARRRPPAGASQSTTSPSTNPAGGRGAQPGPSWRSSPSSAGRAWPRRPGGTPRWPAGRPRPRPSGRPTRASARRPSGPCSPSAGWPTRPSGPTRCSRPSTGRPSRAPTGWPGRPGCSRSGRGHLNFDTTDYAGFGQAARGLATGFGAEGGVLSRYAEAINLARTVGPTQLARVLEQNPTDPQDFADRFGRGVRAAAGPAGRTDEFARVLDVLTSALRGKDLAEVRKSIGAGDVGKLFEEIAQGLEPVQKVAERLSAVRQQGANELLGRFGQGFGPPAAAGRHPGPGRRGRAGPPAGPGRERGPASRGGTSTPSPTSAPGTWTWPSTAGRAGWPGTGSGAGWSAGRPGSTPPSTRASSGRNWGGSTPPSRSGREGPGGAVQAGGGPDAGRVRRGGQGGPGPAGPLRQLTKALENLTNAAARTAGAQERLAQIEKDKEGRLGFAERVAYASPEERLGLNRGLQLANTGNERGGAALT
jgi:hypothetical protein